MEKLPSKTEVMDNTPLDSIEPIEMGGVKVENREDLTHFVEAPLLEACQQFYDKGIETVLSSANKKDIQTGYAHIALDFDSLTSINKEIALSLGEEGMIHGSIPRKGIYIKIPVTVDSTLGEIKKGALAIAGRFENQREGIPT